MRKKLNNLRNQLIPVISIISIISVISIISGYAQTYTFSYTTGNPYTTNLPGATSLNNGMTWDDEEYLIPIGFTFSFFDQSFDSIYISDHARFSLNGDYRINAFFVDFIDRDTINGGYDNTGPTTNSISPVSYVLDGTPGSRILKIEWNNAGFLFELINSGTLNDFVNVQLWLYEGSNDVEVHIGPNSVISPNSSYNTEEGASIGFITYSNDTIILIGSADSPSSTAQYNDHITGTPTSGVIYKFVNNLSGINEEELLIKHLKIYPNPANERINITFDNSESKRIEIKLFDILGRTIYEKGYTNINSAANLSIDISEFRSGIYFIQVQTDRGILNRKIVVQ